MRFSDWVRDSKLIWLRPRTKISKREVGCLKDCIRHRLKTEDYTCRLPKVKPRVRYKLTTYRISFTRKVWK